MIHWHFEDKERPRKSLMKIAYCDQDPIGFIDGRKDGPFTFTSVDPRFRDCESGRMRLLVDRLERQERGFKGKQSMLDEAIAGVENLGITVPSSENPEPSSLQWEQMTAPQGPAIKGTLSVDQLPPNQSPRCGEVSVWARMAPSLPTGDKWAELDMTARKASQHQATAKKHGVTLMVRSGRVFAQRAS